MCLRASSIRFVRIHYNHHYSEATLRRLLEACRRTGRAEAASIVALLLGDKAAAAELAVAAARPEDAATLSGGAGKD